jgi:hypothetical protein
MEIRITLKVENGNLTTETDDQPNYFSEPSLIWTQLPVKPNSDLEEKPMYYPCYSRLTPEHRFQYLSWLKNVEEKTNLSYVFLYFYGLERQLLIGNFESALEETIRLVNSHEQKFRSYISRSLIGVALYRKKLDIIEKIPFILEEINNPSLCIRAMMGKSLSAKEIISMSSFAKFSNRRYINKFPNIFEKELDKVIMDFEKERGPMWVQIDLKSLPQSEERVFLNLSIPDKIAMIKWPQLIHNAKFANLLYKFLYDTHKRVKLLHPKEAK